MATFLGTMGLPHVLVRFYTNPDGHAARRTTVRVLGLLALFYSFPALYGALGRALTPQLYMTGQTDSVVLSLPKAAWPGTVGTLLRRADRGRGVRRVPVDLLGPAGVAGRDDQPRHLAAGAARAAQRISVRRWRFRAAALCAMVIPALLALLAQSIDISILVGWAFAIAASTFCPMFLLGVWWTRLTARGAAAGMLAGATLATAAIFTGLALGDAQASVAAALLAQPALITVPVAFLVMIGVSLRDPARPEAAAEMLALHAPEGLGLRLTEDDIDGRAEVVAAHRG